MKTANKWLNDVPDSCQCCGKPFGKYFYDADTGFGWGLVCDDCFASHGCSLGIGHGQKYITETKKGVAGFDE